MPPRSAEKKVLLWQNSHTHTHTHTHRHTHTHTHIHTHTHTDNDDEMMANVTPLAGGKGATKQQRRVEQAILFCSLVLFSVTYC